MYVYCIRPVSQNLLLPHLLWQAMQAENQHKLQTAHISHATKLLLSYHKNVLHEPSQFSDQ